MKRSFSIAVLLACAGLFAFGIARLFALRFQAGDVYPPYSSLRADPLGTMALYEGLEKMPGISVRRDYSADDRLPDEPRTVYLQLASGRRDWDWMPDDLYQEIRRYLARGNRLVITFFPQTEADYRFHGETSRTNIAATPPEKKTMKQPPGKAKPSEPDHEPGMSPATEWGFQVSFQALEADGNNYLPAAAMRRADLPLPATLAWHSGLVFTNLDPAWQVIYARGTNAVVIERRFGPGSVVMATDSYLVSNEAMLKDRQAALLAWLVGANRHVVFDESHFGIVETSSVAMLVRKYRLHGLVAGLLLLAVLFLWKNSTSLVPAVPAPRPGAVITGKDFGAGFVNLLRRNIPAGQLLGVCMAEWQKSAGQTGAASPARRQQAEALFAAQQTLPARERNPVATYKKVSELLTSRKSKS